MTVLEEGDLQITIGDAINARKFDDANHGLNHCMKVVAYSTSRRGATASRNIPFGDKMRKRNSTLAEHYAPFVE